MFDYENHETYDFRPKPSPMLNLISEKKKRKWPHYQQQFRELKRNKSLKGRKEWSKKPCSYCRKIYGTNLQFIERKAVADIDFIKYYCNNVNSLHMPESLYEPTEDSMQLEWKILHMLYILGGKIAYKELVRTSWSKFPYQLEKACHQ